MHRDSPDIDLLERGVKAILSMRRRRHTVLLRLNINCVVVDVNASVRLDLIF